MTSRRSFFRQLAISVAAISAPTIFIPKLIERPKWKSPEKLWIANPNWVEAPYEIAFMQWPTETLLQLNPNYKAWRELLIATRWKHNMGGVLRAV